MTAQDLLPILLAFSIVAVSPGPANLAVATVSMASGRRRGVIFGAGLATGLAIWGILAALGLGTLLERSLIGITVMKIAGGLYLLWLAYQSAQSAMSRKKEKVTVGQSRLFRRGLLLNLSNPKAVVAWMATLSMGLGAGTEAGELWLATLLCMAIGALNYTGHALLFSLPTSMSVYARLKVWIEGTAAALFAAAGFGLLRSAAAR